MLKSRQLILVPLLILAGLLLAACQPETVIETVVVTEVVEIEGQEVVVTEIVEVTAVPTTVPEAPAEPKILRIGATADMYRFDPEVPTDVTVGNNVNIFDTLTRFDENFGLQPWLATSWEYDTDRGVWVFQIRDDVFFHDGEQLTAHHIADYFNYFSIESFMAELLQISEGATTAVDDFTLEIESANLQLPANASHNTMGIRRGDPFNDEHIGTGPFIYEEYVPFDHINVRANPDWWGGAPTVDGIEMTFMPDPITRLLALQAGEVDVIFDPPRDALGALQGRDDLVIYDTEPGSFQQLDIVVTGEEPYELLQDERLREAIGYAIDRQGLIDLGWGGFAAEGQTLIAPGLLGDSVGIIEGYTYDPDRAVALLEEAGWVDSDDDGIRDQDGRALNLRLVNGWPSAAENGDVPEVLQSQLAEVGIGIEIIPVQDFSSYATYLIPKEADIFLNTWTNTAPSPCQIPTFGFLFPEEPNLWQSLHSPGFVGYGDEINEELTNCSSSTVQADAENWAAEALHTVMDEARTSISLLGLSRIWATTNDVVEFVPHPVQGYVRWELTQLAD
ncbi:MAG: ABC transporter substrate-binding protein [Anaerolineales bacterium]|nr:ABC transporter substrate-binding protein [Anaerolineales bacterium]